MAASMGVYLTFGALILWHRWGDASRPVRLALATLLPLFAVAIFFTYTRSTWLGAAGAVLVVMMLEFRGAWRQMALAGAVVAVPDVARRAVVVDVAFPCGAAVNVEGLRQAGPVRRAGDRPAAGGAERRRARPTATGGAGPRRGRGAGDA